MNEKQYYKILFIIGIIFLLTGALFMYLGLFPLPFRIILGIIGLSFLTNSRNMLNIKKT